MKQAILHFHSGDYLLVELPAGATNVIMYRPFNKHFHLSCDLPPSREGVHTIFGTCFPYKNFGGKKNYPSEILLIGKLSEVTEEQFARIVQVISNGRISGKPQYRKYNDKTLIPANMWVRSARESFFSKMEAEGLDLDPDRSFLFRILNKQS